MGGWGASLVAQVVKNSPAMWETWVRSQGWEDPLEKGTSTHSSVLGLPRWLSGKESACNAGDLCLIPGEGKSPEGEHSNLLQYSCLENSMDKRNLAGYSSMGVTKSWTGLSDFHSLISHLGLIPHLGLLHNS